MEEGHSPRMLQAGILKLSQAQDWSLASKEWRLVSVYFADAGEPERCVCGKAPIIEVCIIRNEATKSVAHVGNRCVRRFMGPDSEKVFAGLRRIRKDIEASLSGDLYEYARQNGMLRPQDIEFLSRTNSKRKSSLSERQMPWRQDINRRILQAVSRRGLAEQK